ncbi:methyl-accepting chemotaxis protein [Brachyspira intermedia]|uniref:methyl-accepting chemotaxis protein n=1 Tax=Brachyspira intermedia TaxID=84377 RepID=UPI00261047EF|nr:methyl-accepting chemotaxis protein [uncultured Brachyspira sp.]
MKKSFNNLTFKMPFTIILIVIIVMTAIIIVSGSLSNNIMNNKIKEGFEGTLSGYTFSVDSWVNNQIANAKFYASIPSVIEMSKTSNWQNYQESLNTLRGVMKENPYVIDVGISTIDGSIKFDTSLDESVYNLLIKDLQPGTWKRFVDSGYDNALANDISISLTTGKPSTIVIVGIKDENNKSIAVLYTMLDWNKLIEEVMANVKLPAGADLSIISDTLEIIANKDPKLIKTQIDEKYKEIISIQNGYTRININNNNIETFFNKLKTQAWYTVISIPQKIANAETYKMIIINTSVVCFGIIIIFIFVYIFAKSITTPLNYILEESKNMNNGNLNSNIPQKIKSRKDELGQMSQYFSKMQEYLADMIHSINDMSYIISEKSNKIFYENANLAKRVEDQAASLEETSSSMEEFASGLKNSTERSIEIRDIMTEATDSIEQVGIMISQTTSNIEDVNESSSKIKNITKMIEDIAFQTNILALNAAVEAARAGEQGRGFAVVASEVRNLAQNSQASVKEITSLIDESVNKINTATNSVRESHKIFEELKDRIINSANLINEISHTIQEQFIGIEQVNKAVSQMDNVTQQNAVLASETSNLSSELLDKSKELHEQISFFKF